MRVKHHLPGPACVHSWIQANCPSISLSFVPYNLKISHRMKRINPAHFPFLRRLQTLKPVWNRKTVSNSSYKSSWKWGAYFVTYQLRVRESLRKFLYNSTWDSCKVGIAMDRQSPKWNSSKSGEIQLNILKNSVQFIRIWNMDWQTKQIYKYYSLYFHLIHFLHKTVKQFNQNLFMKTGKYLTETNTGAFDLTSKGACYGLHSANTTILQY